MQPKYTTKVSCISCQKQWFKRTSAIKTWTGKCMSCSKIGSVPWNKGKKEGISRRMREVVCKTCNKTINKRNDCIKGWSGNCKSCASKLIVRKKQPLPTCPDCRVNVHTKGAKCRPCSTQSRSGKNHYKWKGGITTESRYQRTLFHKFIKPIVLKRDDYTCRDCGLRGVNLHIDHIKSWAEHPSERFNIDNCQTLCMACHYNKTFNRKLPENSTWGNNLSKTYVV